MKRYAVFILLLWLALPLYQVGAQQPAMTEDTFWGQLLDTDSLLEKAAEDVPNNRDTLRKIRALWKDVDRVQLADGTVMQVDTDWLMIAEDASPEKIKELQNRVRALLDYQAQHGGLPSNNIQLMELLRRLRERFRYSDDDDSLDMPNVEGASLVAQVLQIIFVIVAVIVIMAMLSYFMGGLRAQVAELPTEINEEELPTTSQAADALADQSASNTDYRAAIRYLYLSSLLSLDERGVIHYDPTQTNIEHLRQLKNKPQVLGLLTDIIDIFDHVWYGFAPVSADLYQYFRQQVDQLKRFQA
jgi:hypothetical protein